MRMISDRRCSCLLSTDTAFQPDHPFHVGNDHNSEVLSSATVLLFRTCERRAGIMPPCTNSLLPAVTWIPRCPSGVEEI
jgi:hypothetical protein